MHLTTLEEEFFRTFSKFHIRTLGFVNEKKAFSLAIK